MAQILPAILAKTAQEYNQKLIIAEDFGAEWVQIDIEDEKFGPEKTIGANVVFTYPTSLKLDIQLMVEYPQGYVEDFVKAKVQRIVTPIENTAGLDEVIKHVKNHQIEVGLSLNPDTPPEKVEHLISQVDLILVMSVNPGPSGQKFIPEVLGKIRYLRSQYPSVNIEVDGGIDKKSAHLVCEAGANLIVAGSYIFDSDDPKRSFEELKRICQ